VEIDEKFLNIFKSLTPREQKMIVDLCVELSVKNIEIKQMSKYMIDNVQMKKYLKEIGEL